MYMWDCLLETELGVTVELALFDLFPMSVLRTFKACVRKQSAGHQISVDEAESSKPCDNSARVLIDYFVAVAQVSARGVSREAGAAATSRSHDTCTHCGLPVFLAERLLVGTKRALYHRTCFRCARCSAQLTLANCYETEDGSFCCETCPDEEMDKSDTSSQGTGVDLFDSKNGSLSNVEVDQKSLCRNTSLSDDEKSSESQLGRVSGAVNSSDEYSALFESTVEKFHRSKPSKQPSTGEAPLAQSQQEPNDLESKADELSQKTLQNTDVYSDLDKGPEPLDQCDELSLCRSTKEDTKSCSTPMVQQEEESLRIISAIEKRHSDSNAEEKHSVHSSCLISDSSVNQPSVSVGTEVSNCTKDSEISSADSSVSSIVKIRRMMFESDTRNKSVANSNAFRKSGSISSEVAQVKEASKIEKKEFLQGQESRSIQSEQENCDVKADVEDADPVSSPQSNRVESELSSNESNKSFDTRHHDLSNMNDDSIPRTEMTYAEEKRSEEKQVIDSKSSVEVIKQENKSSASPNSLLPTKPSVSPRKISLPPKEPPTQPVKNEAEEYPDELNPFGDEEQEEVKLVKNATSSKAEERKKESTNPFGSSEEDEPVTLRRKSLPDKPPRRPPPPNFQKYSTGGRPTTIAMGSSSSPVPANRRVIPAPASLNPFWSDGEEPDDESASAPVPLPRTIRQTPEPSPRPRTTVGGSSKLTSSSGAFGSSSSLSSMASSTGTHRRSKKPAPAPPPPAAVRSTSPRLSVPSSPNPSIRSPHKRKSRPAPAPPSSVKPDASSSKSSSLDGRKLQKDEANRSMQAGDKEDLATIRDKSTFGQWKRKKGPAPPRPLPQRRQVRAMPMKEVKRELDDIEVKQLELERQGVKLEQTIRMKFDQAPSLNESSMTADVEDLVLQLFEIVNEKNELFRKQAELMYLRRQQRLEEEHAELEYEIRCLMEQPERNKTDIMKAREEELIQRLVEVVERRNEIIECLEMDRIREAEEDHSIHTRLGLFAAKSAKDTVESSPSKSKKEKKKRKEKDSKKKKDLKIDADKDIDEVEAAAVAAAVKEKKSKKKWF